MPLAPLGGAGRGPTTSGRRPFRTLHQAERSDKQPVVNSSAFSGHRISGQESSRRCHVRSGSGRVPAKLYFQSRRRTVCRARCRRSLSLGPAWLPRLRAVLRTRILRDAVGLSEMVHVRVRGSPPLQGRLRHLSDRSPQVASTVLPLGCAESRSSRVQGSCSAGSEGPTCPLLPAVSAS